MNIQENKILFLLLHWNDTEALIKIYTKIKHLSFEHSICIIDNNSNDASKTKLKNAIDNSTIIWNSKNMGFGAALNKGIEKGLQDFTVSHICVLNNDIEFENKAIESFTNKCFADENTIAWSPIINENGKLTFGGKDIAKNLNTRIYENENAALSYLPGTFVLIKKTAFEKIGFFDEQYFFGGETADFCKRLTDNDLSFKVDKSYEVKHFSDASGNLKQFYAIRNRLLYIKKFHTTAFSLMIVNIFKILKVAFGALVSLQFRKFASILRALFYGLFSLKGNRF